MPVCLQFQIGGSGDQLLQAGVAGRWCESCAVCDQSSFPCRGASLSSGQCGCGGAVRQSLQFEAGLSSGQLLPCGQQSRVGSGAGDGRDSASFGERRSLPARNAGRVDTGSEDGCFKVAGKQRVAAGGEDCEIIDQCFTALAGIEADGLIRLCGGVPAAECDGELIHQSGACRQQVDSEQAGSAAGSKVSCTSKRRCPLS